MRKQMVTLLAVAMLSVCSMFAVTSLASAFTVGSPSFDVGGLDTLKAATHLANSGDQTEIDWVNSVLGTSFTKSDLLKYDTPEGSPFVATNENARTVAAELKGTPEFYFIKTGNIGTGKVETNDHFLFTNEASLDWAVLNLDTSFGEGSVINGIGKFSHIGEVGEVVVAPVPEPCTMLLLGAGLLGFAAFGKRRTNKEA